MLIGILSDTHDNVPRTRGAVAFLNDTNVGLVLHAGDVIAPFMIGTLKDLTVPLIGVYGNNDGDRELLMKTCARHPHISFGGTFARFSAGGLSVALTHGSDRDLLDALICGGTFDLVVCGHTHRPEVREQGRTLVVNPGEVCGYLSGKSTVAVADTARHSARIIEMP